MREYTAIPYEYLDEMDVLSDEEYGRLIRAIQRYSMTGEEPNFDGPDRVLQVCWRRAKSREDRYRESFDAQDRERSRRGKDAAKARWGSQADANACTSISDDANACASMLDDADACTSIKCNAKNAKTNTNTKTETETNTKTEDTPQKPPKGAVTERFERFWAIYPNKTGKQAALKTWSRLKPSAELTEVILAAVEYQRTWGRWTKDGGRYIPNPATWLNQGRWEDQQPQTGQAQDATYQVGQSELNAIANLERMRDAFAGGDQDGG